MASFGDCCCCPVTLEVLPDYQLDGWVALDWVINSSTCCAIRSYGLPTTPTATFIDGGDIDSNTRTFSCSSETYLLIQNQYVLPGTPNGNGLTPPLNFDAPDRECPPCPDPIYCADHQSSTFSKRATRAGVLIQPFQVTLEICFRPISCDGDPAEPRYIIKSVYSYLYRTMTQLYETSSGSHSSNSHGCCSFDTDPDYTYNNPGYSPSDPRFWGFSSGSWPTLSPFTDGSFSFTRYELDDELPLPDTLAFTNADCPDCVGLANCSITQVCFEFDGVANSEGYECRPRTLVEQDCDLFWAVPCNGLWSYIDTDGSTKCTVFLPPVPVATNCPSITVARKAYKLTSESDPDLCDDVRYSSGGCGAAAPSTADCATDESLTCPWTPPVKTTIIGHYGNILALSDVVVCSGGTDASVCVNAPSWTFTT